MPSLNPCDLPVVQSVCGAVGAAAGAASSAVLDGFVDGLCKGYGKAVEIAVSFWTKLPAVDLADPGGPVAQLQDDLRWVVAVVAVLGVIVNGGRLALGKDSRPAVDTARGLGVLIAVTALVGPVAFALLTAGDAFASWILDRATGGAMGARMLALTALLGPLGPGLALVAALFGIAAAIIQIGLSVVRIGLVVLLTGVAQVPAGAAMTGRGQHTLNRLLSWDLAFILYTPAAAVVYASAFRLLGTGGGPQEVLAGLTMLCLSVVALPALLRLLAPVLSNATSHSGAAAHDRLHAAAASGAKAGGRMAGSAIGSLRGGGQSGGSSGSGGAPSGAKPGGSVGASEGKPRGGGPTGSGGGGGQSGGGGGGSKPPLPVGGGASGSTGRGAPPKALPAGGSA